MEFSSKPNYFLFAQLLIHHIENYVKKHPDVQNAIFDLRDVYEVFRQDLAASTTNLEGILNIADEYRIDTLQGDQKIISGFKIDAEQNSLLIDFNKDALQALKDGNPILAPDATIQE